MSDARQLAETAAARLKENKRELLACMRSACQEGRELDAELAWRLIERQVKLWAIDTLLQQQIEPRDDRRGRAEYLAASAKQTRELFAGSIKVRQNGHVWEIGGELIRELYRGDAGAEIEFREIASTADVLSPIAECPAARARARLAATSHERETAIRRIMEALETLEAAANAVARRHPPEGRGRRVGSGQLPPDRVEWLGWAFSSLTGSDWGTAESGPFVEFVQIIGAAIGLSENYDVRGAIKRARPDYVPPPSRLKENRNRRKRATG